MQIVIEISETLKQIADEEDAKTFNHIMWQAILMDAIKNGTPLPKGHGRLIDADRLKEVVHRNTVFDLYDEFVDVQPIVIEADEVEE